MALLLKPRHLASTVMELTTDDIFRVIRPTYEVQGIWRVISMKKHDEILDAMEVYCAPIQKDSIIKGWYLTISLTEWLATYVETPVPSGSFIIGG